MRRIASWTLMAVLIWGVKAGWGVWNVVHAEPLDFEPPSVEEQAEWILEDDARFADEIAGGRARVARGWLDQPRHGTFEADPDQLRELIETFHAAGASGVWMVGIERLGKHQLSDGIAVELPAAGPARDRLFAAEAEFWGGEGTPDVGQRYLSVFLD